MILLQNRNVDEVVAAAIAARLGSGDGAVTVFHSRREDALALVLAAAAMFVVDADCEDVAAAMPAGPDVFVLRIATAAAAQIEVAEAFTQAVLARCPQATRCRADLHVALQEAIGNAVMHGNLALDGTMRRGRDCLPLFGAAMAERIADPTYGRRPITVSAQWGPRRLVVSVEDVGAGFDPAIRSPDCHCPHGNGIADILSRCDQVTFADGGRRISMVFMTD